MAIELKVPTVGESITEVIIGEWLKREGEWVAQDDVVVVIETDKVNVELPAPQDGVVSKILKDDGDDATVGEVVGHLEAAERPDGADAPASDAAASDAPRAASAEEAAPTPAAPAAASTGSSKVMPAARRAAAEAGVDPAAVAASGPKGNVLKEDVARHVAAGGAASPARAAASVAPAGTGGVREEEVVSMSPFRRRVAERLVEAQQTAAILTTFNEIDMSAVMALRKQYKEPFLERHGVKLGFMSFFVKATVEALKAVPGVNAEIRGNDIVYRNYYDIGVAVGGGKGLVVPIIRNAERLSFAEVESTIGELAGRARANKLTLDELQGGTFTISNGGIYGSLLSTPILNPPQSGILGMHKIEERPIAVNGEVVVRPMMYVALSYDHRLIDGREAVTFLVKIKEAVEDPTRILLET